MKITKTAVVSVVGRPNVGKSTLTNKLVGQKVAIVSSKPQTTRTRITGLLNKNGTQYVFLDTPGLHKPRTQLGDYMCKVVTDTVSEVDAAMLVVEPIANIGPAEESLIAQIKQHHMPAILVINKIDTVKKEELLNVIATYAAAHEFEAVVPISARTGEGLDELLREIQSRAAAMLHRVRICVPYSKGQLVSRIHEQGNVISEEYDAEGTVIIATLDQIALDRISRELPVGGVELLGAKS